MNWQIIIMAVLLLMVIVQAIIFAHFRIPLPMQFKVEVWEDPFTGDQMHYTICITHPYRPDNVLPLSFEGRILTGNYTSREMAEDEAAAWRVFLATGSRVEQEMVL